MIGIDRIYLATKLGEKRVSKLHLANGITFIIAYHLLGFLKQYVFNTVRLLHTWQNRLMYYYRKCILQCLSVNRRLCFGGLHLKKSLICVNISEEDREKTFDSTVKGISSD